MGLGGAFALRGRNQQYNSNMVSGKTHSSLVDCEVAFGEDQSVIGIAGERRGQQLCKRLVTHLLEPLYRKSHNGVMGLRLLEWMYAGVGCTVLRSQGIVHSDRNDKILSCLVGYADLDFNSTRKGLPVRPCGRVRIAVP